MTYRTILCHLIKTDNAGAYLKFPSGKKWIAKTDMSYASWYLLLETAPRKEVSLKIMERAL